ncbi:hypothetical protein C8J57DRAFT_1680652 [Mycena rebaudengoi]|nr:hypothetical protein C8J57DRAFT_1680652 [Mycena rebaudengoi]
MSDKVFSSFAASIIQIRHIVSDNAGSCTRFSPIFIHWSRWCNTTIYHQLLPIFPLIDAVDTALLDELYLVQFHRSNLHFVTMKSADLYSIEDSSPIPPHASPDAKPTLHCKLASEDAERRGACLRRSSHPASTSTTATSTGVEARARCSPHSLTHPHPPLPLRGSLLAVPAHPRLARCVAGGSSSSYAARPLSLQFIARRTAIAYPQADVLGVVVYASSNVSPLLLRAPPTPNPRLCASSLVKLRGHGAPTQAFRARGGCDYGCCLTTSSTTLYTSPALPARSSARAPARRAPHCSRRQRAVRIFHRVDDVPALCARTLERKHILCGGSSLSTAAPDVYALSSLHSCLAPGFSSPLPLLRLRLLRCRHRRVHQSQILIIKLRPLRTPSQLRTPSNPPRARKFSPPSPPPNPLYRPWKTKLGEWRALAQAREESEIRAVVLEDRARVPNAMQVTRAADYSALLE